MSEALSALIGRMEAALRDEDTKPLWLHWTDLEMLKDIQLELADDDRRIARLKTTVGDALDLALQGIER